MLFMVQVRLVGTIASITCRDFFLTTVRRHVRAYVKMPSVRRFVFKTDEYIPEKE